MIADIINTPMFAIVYGITVMYCILAQEQKFRGLGSSNGRYNDTRYFPCDNKCGEFVALDGLSRMKVEHKRKFRSLHLDQKPDFSASMTVGLPGGERVIVYNRKSVPIHGTVRWRGRHGTLGDIVGIETVSCEAFVSIIPMWVGGWVAVFIITLFVNHKIDLALGLVMPCFL